MTDQAASTCRGCEALKRELQKVQEKMAALEAELARSKKDSTNSSKPPSSDLVKPPRPAKGAKKPRKRGGQPGHPRHERTPFTEDQINRRLNYFCESCPDCGGETVPIEGEPRVVQQIEIIPVPIRVSEHRSHPCWCAKCQKVHYKPIPDRVRRAGLIGPRLTAFIAYLKSACHCSYSTIRKFLRDVARVKISRGQLRKICAKVSESLLDPYEELLRLLPQEGTLNVDETGHKDNGRQMWTWCFRASLFTLFKIHPSRSSDVLVEVLGEEFNGVLGCDYFSAYRKYMGKFDVLVQFCLAHLIRDVKFLVKHPDGRTRAYGDRVLHRLRQLFEIIHARDKMTPAQFSIALQDAGDELEAEAMWRVPATREAQNLARRFEKHGDSYLQFITTPGIEPTNNLAEQAIRFVVIDRHVTQGSRSEDGQRWLERIWTVIATCAQQGREVFEFLCDSVQAHFAGVSAPSLAPDTS